MIQRTKDQMVAYCLEIDEALLPFADELLRDLDELGSDAEAIVETLELLDLPANARVLDLGCGKGATAVEIATELGLQVVGVDLYLPFIESCRKAAAAAGVSHLCTFIHADVLDFVEENDGLFDVVVFSALGDVFGPMDETIGLLRRFAKPGGLILVSDVFLLEGGSTDFDGFRSYVPMEETVARLESFGDKVERVVLEEEHGEEEQAEEEQAEEEPVQPPEEGADGSGLSALDDTSLIRRRAVELAEKHPELESKFQEFVEGQSAEVAFLEENFGTALWVVRRLT